MTQPLAPGVFAKALQERRESERRRRRMIWGGIGGAVVLLALVVYLVAFSPVLAARQVAVNGTTLLSVDQVTQAAAVELGVPLARQDTAAIAARVGDLAPVREVSVSRSYPDTVTIDVTERTLTYQLAGAGAVDWVDDEGIVFNSTPAATDGVIQVSAGEADDRLRRDIATVVTGIPDAVRPLVSLITAEAVDGITLELSDGRTVVWGSADESDLKGEVLAALLSVEAEVYDVSAPRHPTTR